MQLVGCLLAFVTFVRTYSTHYYLESSSLVMDMETNLNIMHIGILERHAISRHSIPPYIP